MLDANRLGRYPSCWAHRRTRETVVSLKLRRYAEFSERMIDAVDKAHGNSRGWKWNRDEIYERDDRT